MYIPSSYIRTARDMANLRTNTVSPEPLLLDNVISTTVKPVLSSHSKTDKTKILMINGSLMKVKSIAECCNTFDLH